MELDHKPGRRWIPAHSPFCSQTFHVTPTEPDSFVGQFVRETEKLLACLLARGGNKATKQTALQIVGRHFWRIVPASALRFIREKLPRQAVQICELLFVPLRLVAPQGVPDVAAQLYDDIFRKYIVRLNDRPHEVPSVVVQVRESSIGDLCHGRNAVRSQRRGRHQAGANLLRCYGRVAKTQMGETITKCLWLERCAVHPRNQARAQVGVPAFAERVQFQQVTMLRVLAIKLFEQVVSRRSRRQGKGYGHQILMELAAKTRAIKNCANPSRCNSTPQLLIALDFVVQQADGPHRRIGGLSIVAVVAAIEQKVFRCGAEEMLMLGRAILPTRRFRKVVLDRFKTSSIVTEPQIPDKARPAAWLPLRQSIKVVLDSLSSRWRPWTLRLFFPALPLE